MEAMDRPQQQQQQQRRRHGNHRDLMEANVEAIDLEIGICDEESLSAAAAAAAAGYVTVNQHSNSHQNLGEDNDSSRHSQSQLSSSSTQQQQQQQVQPGYPHKKKKVVKKWRDEWADMYKWAFLNIIEGSPRIFCSVCKEYGRKHRRNPYGNEGSRNMQMSALEEHNNSLLHKEAVRLQLAAKDKGITTFDRPVHTKVLLSKSAESIVESIIRRDPQELEFIQAAQEVVRSLEPVLSKHPQYIQVLESLLEPNRTIIFRVPWVDDKGDKHVNRGFRVQFSQTVGSYKGGLRFHPSVNLSVMKCLALEETLKNALTNFSFGGAAGGSDFDPRNKSDIEVMRFCQSFMEELYRHIGPNKDALGGGLGVGSRELGYLYGMYRRLTGQHEYPLMGGRNDVPNSYLHAEATGHGLVYFAKHALVDLNKELKNLRCAVSGFGKVALHVIEKLIVVGAFPITLSDSSGYLLDNDGFDSGKLMFLKDMKSQQMPLREYTARYARALYYEDAKPWGAKCSIAFPCATNNELNRSDAMSLISGGCLAIIEGSDMACTPDAIEWIRKSSKTILAPSKAAAAGGVAVCALELASKNNQIHWSPDEIDNKLQELMADVYQKSSTAANACGVGNGCPDALVHGANIAAFLRVAEGMLEQGCV